MTLKVMLFSRLTAVLTLSPAHGAQTVEVKFSDVSFTASTAVKVNKSGKFTVIDSKSGKFFFCAIPPKREF